jgi:hypothetical protein
MFPEALHHTEDPFRRLAGVGDLHGQHTAGGDGLEEEPSSDPGGHAHLTRFQHDVVTTTLVFVPDLSGVRIERALLTRTVSHFEELACQPDRDRLSVRPVDLLIERPTQLQ